MSYMLYGLHIKMKICPKWITIWNFCVKSESVVKTVVKTTKSLGATLNPQVWICAGYVGKNILMDQDPCQAHSLSGYFYFFFCCHNLLVLHTRCLSLTFLLISNIYTGHALYISFHKLFSSSVICQTPDTTSRTLCRYFGSSDDLFVVTLID